MDMKKILQALDGASTKPVEGSNDMKKFVQIVNEGANPHKVSLPVQMAMQHYAEHTTEKVNERKDSVFKKYFAEAEQEINQKAADRKVHLNQYAAIIAERVRLKESTLKDKADLKAKRKALQDIQMDPSTSKDPELKKELVRRKHELEKQAKEKGLDESADQVDSVTIGIPLLIRLLEYAKEDAQSDMDLHNVAERIIALSKEQDILSMDDYDAILGAPDLPPEPEENI